MNFIKLFFWSVNCKESEILSGNFTPWKVPKYGVISDPNTGKYGPDITPYLHNFNAGLG